VAIIGLWLDPDEDDAVHEAWTAALWRTVRPEGSGVYVNFLEVEGPDRVREAYPPATFARLAAIKRRYDPRNLFRFNQNVPPAPSPSMPTLARVYGMNQAKRQVDGKRIEPTAVSRG
jgi:hypothetical protein